MQFSQSHIHIKVKGMLISKNICNMWRLDIAEYIWQITSMMVPIVKERGEKGNSTITTTTIVATTHSHKHNTLTNQSLFDNI